MRVATQAECPTGGAVISDATSSVTVCNGAAGAAGAPGTTGPQGIQGPPGPAGSAPVNEETSVVAVTNLLVDIAGMPSFRPTAVSRIGIDVPVIQLQNQRFNGMPSFPPFKLMLGADAPLAALDTWWRQVLQGQTSTRNVTIRIQAVEGASFADASILDVRQALVVGFSNGTVGPPSITLLPEFIRASEAPSIGAASYALVDLPVLTSPTIEFQNASTFAGLHRISGGEIQLSLEGLGEIRVPEIVQTLTDLRFTAVARTPPQLNGNVDLDVFTPFYEWIDSIVMGTNQDAASFAVKQREASSGAVTGTIIYEDCLPTKITFVNPALVEGGVAPWVFDVSVRPRSALVP